MLCIDRNHPYERRRRHVAIGRRVLIAVACTLTMCIAGVTGAGASSQGGVLAGTTAPRGWSLTRITAAAAVFDVSNNNPSDYPTTPFQLLYYAPSTLTVTSMKWRRCVFRIKQLSRCRGHSVLRSHVQRR